MNPRPQPQGIPLRADPDALVDHAMRSLSRSALATALGARHQEHVGYAEDFTAKMWPHDREASLLTKGAVSPATVADTQALSVISLALLRHLMPVSAAANVLGAGISVSFAGTSRIAIPALTAPTIAFARESDPVQVSRLPTSTAAIMERHKLAVLCGLTRELMDGSNAEQLIRQMLIDSCGAALDAVLFDATAAVPELRPAGLLNGVTALTPSADTSKREAMADDVAALIAAVSAVGGGSTIALVAAPKQAVALMMRAQRLGFPVHMSSALPNKTIIAVATNAVAAALDLPEIGASRDAVVHIESSDVAPIVVYDDGENGGPVMATPVYSMFQTDSVMLKLRWPVSWAMRDARGIAWMSAVTW